MTNEKKIELIKKYFGDYVTQEVIEKCFFLLGEYALLEHFESAFEEETQG